MSAASPTRLDPRRYLARHALLPLALALACLVVIESTRLDRALSDCFCDPTQATRAERWPLSKHWFFENLMHDGAKYALLAFGALVLIGLAVSFKRRELAPWRRSMLFVLLCLAVCPLVVGMLKSASARPCPWDLALYGDSNQAPYYGLLESAPAAMTRRFHCFPGGHASGGYALFGLYFALRIHAPRRARWMLGLALVYGSAMGFARLAQGAHFLSHNLATAFLCWFLCLALYELMLRTHDERRLARTQTEPARPAKSTRARTTRRSDRRKA